MTDHENLRQGAIDEMKSIESLDRNSLAAWQLKKLNEQLAHTYMNSPFYRKAELPSKIHMAKLRALQMRPDLPKSQCLDAILSTLKFTTKEDLRDEYPFGFLAVPHRDLCRYGESTGSSGRPTSSFITYDDWIAGNIWVEESFRHYFNADDTAFVAIPYELTFASYDIDRALEGLGVTIVATGTLNSICPFDRLIEMMCELHPSVLVCTPTRAIRLFHMLVDRGYDPLEVGLRKLLYVGETCSPSKLRKICDAWRVDLITAYGSTETNSLALPCSFGRSHLSEGRFVFEVVEPDTGLQLPSGNVGELVVTSLRSRAMPLIRYRTGDLAITSEEPCPCGSPRRTLQHLGRSCESIRVAGVTIRKLALEEAVLSVPGTGIYYAAGHLEGQFEVCVETHSGKDEDVCRRVERALADAFNIPASARSVERKAFTAAMDRMLKPGSLTLADITATECVPL